MDAVTLVLALKKSKAYTDAAIAAIAKGMEYKGSVATVSDLPAASSSNKGWLYTVTANSHEYVSDGTQWVDLSADVPAPGSSSPVMDGTASAGSSTTYSRSDHVHPSDTNRLTVKPKFQNWATSSISDIGSYYPTGAAVGNGRYVVVYYGKTYYSSNGITWTKSSFTESRIGVKYFKESGKFYSYGSGGVSLSTDGNTWLTATLIWNRSYEGLCYGGGKYVCCGNNSIYYSSDGSTWYPSTTIPSGYWVDVEYANGKYVVYDYSNKKTAYSTDAVTWTSGSSGVFVGSSSKLMSCGGAFILWPTNYPGTTYLYSTDGLTWSEKTMPSASTTGYSRPYSDHVYYDGKLIMLAYDLIMSTTDGLSWDITSVPSTGMGSGRSSNSRIGYCDSSCILTCKIDSVATTKICDFGLLQNGSDKSQTIANFIAPYISHPSDNTKLDKAQGIAHAGEFLVVGADGNITTQTVPNANGVSF